ncbi:DEAD/DEAH box helicase [Allocoleopsis franciscana]|uniref:DNA/RNA helicase, superfamily II n=1 Tax=Allocoleopsis franciscana PCC 7113 TaxID=1173027 RepID=K9WNP4_9CYAN|nr:DEAD/DEAH box helicase [Allocoleopsis franciscana]AFZ22025.1 DNA/RNA helicase, superfamily II [Allocoleopsis franciscana PCC 7113]
MNSFLTNSTNPFTTKNSKFYQLRDYQQSLVQDIFTAWDSGYQSVLAILPTAGGKTICFVEVASTFLAKNQPVLVIAHLEELITQAADKLAMLGVRVGIIKAGYEADPDALIQVASIQTLVRRELPSSALVIFDEAHHCASRTYSEIMLHYRETGAKILGVTATPNRPDGRGLRSLDKGVPGFDSLVSGPSSGQLIEKGYLCRFSIYAASQLLDAQQAGIETTDGDYDTEQLTEYVKKTLVLGDVVATWKKHAFGLRTVVFAVSVPHAKELAIAFCDAGIAAEEVNGKTPPETRRTILSRFARGETLVLCQHSLLIEGVDVPGIQCVQFCRPTQSLIVWLQAIGRALRPAPGKELALVLDHTHNHTTLPWPDSEIAWSLEPAQIKPDKNTHTCSECNHVFRPTSSEWNSGSAHCPACGATLSLPERQFNQQPETVEQEADAEEKVETKRQNLIEVLPANFTQVSPLPDSKKMKQVYRLLKIQQECGYKKGWLLYRLQEMENELQLGLTEWQEVGKLLDYNPKWALMRWKEFALRQGNN